MPIKLDERRSCVPLPQTLLYTGIRRLNKKQGSKDSERYTKDDMQKSTEFMPLSRARCW